MSLFVLFLIVILFGREEELIASRYRVSWLFDVCDESRMVDADEKSGKWMKVVDAQVEKNAERNLRMIQFIRTQTRFPRILEAMCVSM